MPAHKGPLTFADVMSVVIAGLFIVQPGVDRKALYKWIFENVFYGDYFFLRIWSSQALMKPIEWGCIIVYTLLYTLELPFFERYRVYPNGAVWPWKHPNAEVRTEYRAQQWKAFRYILKFHACVLAIEAARYFWLEKPSANPLTDPEYAMLLVENVPHWSTSAWQVLVGTVIAETGFYWGHRLLHYSPTFYKYHKQHHEFVDTGVLSTFYVSFVDALITDLIPIGFAVLALKMHLYTIAMFIPPQILNAVWVHCGYTHPLRFNPLLVLPLGTESEKTHDLHHRNGKYNYGGAYFVWDRIVGTWRDPDIPNAAHGNGAAVDTVAKAYAEQLQHEKAKAKAA